MAIKVAKYRDAYLGGKPESPHRRACMLAHSGLDYLRAAVCVNEDPDHGPMMAFYLPTMHQTLELLAKAIVFKTDPAFEPKKYSHRLRDLMRAYNNQVPIFATMLSNPDITQLLEGLEKSYLDVRYGEAIWSCDHEDWQLFLRLSEEMLDLLHTLTQLKFLPKHSKRMDV